MTRRESIEHGPERMAEDRVRGARRTRHIRTKRYRRPEARCAPILVPFGFSTRLTDRSGAAILRFMTTSSSTIPATPVAVPSSGRKPGRGLLLLGLALPFLGIGAYALQIWMARLTMPWYLPVTGSIAVLAVLAALWKARSLWRILALVLVLLLAGAQWTLLLALGFPAYAGPVVEGKPFPAFSTLKADGSAFTERDLQGTQNNVLVAFRGRW